MENTRNHNYVVQEGTPDLGKDHIIVVILTGVLRMQHFDVDCAHFFNSAIRLAVSLKSSYNSVPNSMVAVNLFGTFLMAT